MARLYHVRSAFDVNPMCVKILCAEVTLWTCAKVEPCHTFPVAQTCIFKIHRLIKLSNILIHYKQVTYHIFMTIKNSCYLVIKTMSNILYCHFNHNVFCAFKLHLTRVDWATKCRHVERFLATVNYSIFCRLPPLLFNLGSFLWLDNHKNDPKLNDNNWLTLKTQT